MEKIIFNLLLKFNDFYQRQLGKYLKGLQNESLKYALKFFSIDIYLIVIQKLNKPKNISKLLK